LNTRLNIQCKVCGNIVLLKVYGGYVPENRFTYSCPECSITISGYLVWNTDTKKGLIKELSCSNAEIVDRNIGEKSHILQLATEFYTDKIKPYRLTDPTTFFSPYLFENAHSIEKSTIVKTIMAQFDEKLEITLRIWELYKKQNYKYLDRQLISQGFIQKPRFVTESLKVNYSRVIPEIVFDQYAFVFIKNESYSDQLSEVYKIMNTLMRVNSQEMLDLKKDLYNLVTYSDENIVQLLKSFAQYFRLIWPIILTNILQSENIQDIKEKKGILTTNFDMLMNYYVEAYEILCSVLPLFLGVQNIHSRGSRNYFEPEIANNFPKINTICLYEKQVTNKGNKTKFFDKENIFFPLLDHKVLDNVIRNSIGHHSFEYHSDQQLIKFKGRVGDEKELYLIEFGDLLYKTIYTTLCAFIIINFFKYEVNLP